MLDVALLGTGGMMPLPRRWLTSCMMRYNGSSLLIDCGEGTQIALRKLGWSCNQIATILITRYPKSPAANLADVVLLCGSNESPVQQGSVRAKVAQLVVMDVLYQEYCFRNRKACQENLQSIASALTGMHL